MAQAPFSPPCGSSAFVDILACMGAEAELGTKGCDQNTSTCDRQGKEAVDDIKPVADASTATIIIGAVAIVGGGILFLTAPSMGPSESAWRAFPIVSPEFQGVGITGNF